jgi:hypothetical protein
LRAVLVALAIGLIAPASAVAQTQPHVVASANGATARSSANEGEILSCGPAGCTAAITAPARPPATWDGELPVSGRTVIELTFSRPVDLLGAEVSNRFLQRIAVANVARVDDQRWRVTLPADAPPDEAALELHERWEGDDSRGHYTVMRTDFIGLEAPAAVTAVKQSSRGGGVVADVEMRTAGLLDARLAFGKKTLGQKSTNLAAPRTLRVSVPLSRGARRLLASRRTIKARLTLSVRPPSGDALPIEQTVTLRAKRR